MRTRFHLCIVFYLLASFYSNSLSGQIFINEFMAANETTLTDINGEYDDWVELYNAGNQAVNIGGYFASDDLENLTLWQIPNDNPTLTTIPAGGFLILWFDKDTDQGTLHIDAKLSAEGEDIVLTDPDGSTVIDSHTFGLQTADISNGRISDGAATFGIFNSPTPGSSNNQGTQTVAEVEFSQIGGFYTGTLNLQLNVNTPNASIHYTTDGSVPTPNDLLYSSPISSDTSIAIRARAFKVNFEPSEVSTQTYIMNIDHAFPVVAVSGAEEDFFDPETGIFVAIEEDIEIIINAEFYETDGTQGFNQRVEAELSGTSSAVNSQKSLALKAKGSLGNSSFDYPVFPEEDLDEYRSLVLRNSGNDWATTMFRDAAVTDLVRNTNDLDDLISKPELNTLAYRPAIMYLNGSYYGIYNLRERADSRYLKNRFDLDDDEMDFLENYNQVREGDLVEWDSFQDFLENNEFSSNENYEIVKDHVDIEEYTDYMIFNLFVDNQDWPGNNNRRWRERNENGKWRFITFDLDLSFGLLTSDGWNTGFAGDNSLNRCLTAFEFEYPNPEWSARLFLKLLENETWRVKFFNRTADQLNTLFLSDRISNRIDEFLATYVPEKELHNSVWFNLFNQESSAQIMENFGNDRPDIFRQHFIDAFPELNDNATIAVNTQPANGGSIELSTLYIDEEDDISPWIGTYFTGVDIPLKAIPEPGYIFQEWTGLINNSEIETELNLSGGGSLTAVFTQGSTDIANIIINEFNYNSAEENNTGDWLELHNPNNEAVNISGWYIQDQQGNYFNFPANTWLQPNDYLILAEDFTNFNYTVDNLIGEFGGNSPFGEMKFSNSGEALSLFNAGGILIDEVIYEDSAPWAEEADGGGATLQLISPELDNSLAENWDAWTPTPGAINVNSNLIEQNIIFTNIPNKLTTDVPFSISASASSGLDVTVDILSGPATLSNNIITLTGEVGTVLLEANQNGNDSYAAAEPVQQAFTVTEPIDPPQDDECLSGGLDSATLWIESVQLSELANVSGNNGGYADFTDNTATIHRNQFYQINLTSSSSGNSSYWRVWADLNQDDELTEDEMLVEGIQEANSEESTFVFAAPPSANLGAMLMRISVREDAYADPCEQFPIGETEDYRLVIVETSNGSGSIFNLSAQAAGNQIDLFWSANRLNEIASFTIERSEDGDNFTELFTIPNSNTSENITATFSDADNNPPRGRLFYRARKNLISSTVSYSNTVELINGFDIDGVVLFPNPVDQNEELNVSLGTGYDNDVNLEMVDSAGRILFLQEFDAPPLQPVAVSVADIPAGFYCIRISSSGKRTITKKFIRVTR